MTNWICAPWPTSALTMVRVLAGRVAQGDDQFGRSAVVTRQQIGVLDKGQPAHGGDPLGDHLGVRRARRRQVHHCLPAEELAAQRVGCVHGDQVLSKDADPFAQPLRLVQVVRAEEDRAALPAQRLDEVAHGLGGFRIQRAGGLVHEDHRRLVEQRPCDGELLLHALGKGAGLGVAAVPQIEQPQIFLHLPAHILDVVQLGEDFQVAAGAQALVQARRLGEDADLAADLGVGLAHFQPVDPGVARGGADQTGQDANGGRLARAVGAEEAKHLAFVDLQVETIHGFDFAVITLEEF